MNKFELGQTAKDKITGFEGVITSHAKYITGCDQFALQPKCKDLHSYPEAKWFDEGRLILVNANKIESVVSENANGCDFTAPIK